MTAPQPTRNPATITRPERSSERVSRKSPLAWLPWALLAALAALLALVLLAVNAIDDDGAEGPADDRLGQLSSSEDSGAGGSGEAAADADAPEIDLKALAANAVVGGGALSVAPVADVKGAEKLADAKGAAGTVLFAEGSAQIDAGGKEVIAAAAKSLKEAGATRVEVVGHTDVIAGDPVNDTLSKERAENVAAALRKQLPGVEVTVAAKGQDEPVASNDDEAGRQLNRRAVITALG